MAKEKGADAPPKEHNLEALKKVMAPEINKILALIDTMESDAGSHREKIKQGYDAGASATGLPKKVLQREIARIRRNRKERAEELEMSEHERNDIELLRESLEGTPLGTFAQGKLAARLA
jgi:tryptophanyl-tRNA synthetase